MVAMLVIYVALEYFDLQYTHWACNNPYNGFRMMVLIENCQIANEGKNCWNESTAGADASVKVQRHEATSHKNL